MVFRQQVSRVAATAFAAAAFLAISLGTGCRAPRAAEIPTDAPPSIPALQPEAAARADALAWFGEGMRHEYAREPDSAISNYTRAAELDPDNEDLHLRIAVLLLQQKRQNESVRLMEEFVERNPRSEKGLMLLALIYRAAENAPSAERIYRKLIAVAPGKSEAYIELAALQIRQDRMREAIALLEKATRRVKNPADILRVLGAIHIQQAGEAGDSRQTALAIRALERALGYDPDDVALLYQIGDLYARQGETAKAIELFGRVEDIAPDNIPVKQRLAESLLQGREPGDVARVLSRLALSSPHPERVYFYLGDIHAAAKQQDEALAAYRKAAEGPNPEAAAFIKLALMRADSEASETIAILEQGLEKLPGNPRLMEILAYVHFTRTNYTDSLRYFEGALKEAEAVSGPDSINPTFFFNYAIAAQKGGDSPRAAALLQKAIVKNPAFLDAYLQFVFRQETEDEQRESVAVIEKIAELEPGEPNVPLYLGLLNSYLKSYAAALAAFERVENLVKDSPEQESVLDASFYFWYGSAAEREGQIARAEKLFLKCLELEPEHAEALNYLAYMWAERSLNLDKALEMVKKALEITPDSGAFVDTLGWVYFMQGDYDKALAEIRRAAELIPDDPTILDHLGDVLLKLEGEQAAIPHWSRAFVLDPDNEKLAGKLTEHGVDLAPLREEAEKVRQQKAEDKRKAPQGSALDMLLPSDADMLEPEATPVEEDQAPPLDVE